MNKKKMILIAAVAMIALSIPIGLKNKMKCLDIEIVNAMGYTPDADGWFIMPKEDLETAPERAALQHPELFTPEFVAKVRAKYGVSGGSTTTPAASQPAATGNTANNSKVKSNPAVKITVWFTDYYGHVIGSSQITQGTTIADSQFPKEVEDIDGHTFDGWTYDDTAITHERIVRAKYK